MEHLLPTSSSIPPPQTHTHTHPTRHLTCIQQHPSTPNSTPAPPPTTTPHPPPPQTAPPLPLHKPPPQPPPRPDGPNGPAQVARLALLARRPAQGSPPATSPRRRRRLVEQRTKHTRWHPGPAAKHHSRYHPRYHPRYHHHHHRNVLGVGARDQPEPHDLHNRRLVCRAVAA